MQRRPLLLSTSIPRARDVQEKIKEILSLVLIPGPDLVNREAAIDIQNLLINS